MTRRATLLFMFGLLLLGAQARGVAAGPAKPGPAPVATAGPVSPHEDPAACAVCHGPGLPDTAPNDMQLCLDCHPDADMHPVRVTPDTTTVPEGWPLQDGGIACFTCHAEPGCDAERSHEVPWLRGGPVPRNALFCVRCHDAEELKRVDPHHPRAAGAVGAASDPSCVACHHGKPEDGALPADSKLRTAADQICAECHGPAPHIGVSTHVGIKPRADMPPDVALPLDAAGVIQCWTCHDAHGSAGEHAERARPPRARRAADALRALARPDRDLSLEGDGDPDHPPLMALPGTGDRLCRACHGDGG